MEFKVIGYQPELQPIFEELNMAWLIKYFRVEPIDRLVLGNPEKYIIDPGGCVLFVMHENKIIGTAALMLHGDDEIELTKMAVDPSSHGIGAGKFICKSALDKAKEMGFSKVILYSNTKLKPAINIYRNLGFQEIDLEPGVYERADIKMEVIFNNSEN